MSEHFSSAPKGNFTHQQTQKIRPFWRCCIAAASLMGMTLMFVNYQIAKSINLTYFPTHSVPLTALDVLGALLVTYLALVAIFGHWRLLFKLS
ncbi:hypothetical protein RF679_06005 [Undibacterium cyanobacteriorum]|uniref:Uncharacterized protein n=1 Tax=Undibacterium cyanobacteriorum TaxID=3073561 RepID=A0ABY9RMA5_9BURK|nr:hypothetical protein [Undibacterium sp. 20NA77.5]WMW81834.1 hypothetical protein RF679_06005 [Undibacterium sp. 20NA77.5]